MIALDVRYLPSNQGAFMHVRRATAGDAERIAEIYNWYILNTIITFEADVVSPREVGSVRRLSHYSDFHLSEKT